MTCGDMLFDDITDLTTKTIIQVENCVNKTCGTYLEDMST